MSVHTFTHTGRQVAFCSPVVFIEDPEMVDDDALIRSFQEHEQYYKSLGFDAAFAYFDPNDKERRKRVRYIHFSTSTSNTLQALCVWLYICICLKNLSPFPFNMLLTDSQYPSSRD